MVRRTTLIVGMLILAACSGGAAGDDTPTTSTTMPPVPVATGGCTGVDTHSRPALQQAAEEGRIATGGPALLGPAMEDVPQGLLTAIVYAGCYAEEVDALSFERMVWTNGIGVLDVSWQEWPGDGVSVTVPFPGDTHQAGVVQVSASDGMHSERTRLVHLFDGVRVVTVATFSLTTLSIEQVEEMAWAIYDGLPFDSSRRTGIGASRTLADFLAALASPLIPLSDPVSVAELSPFTTGLALAHASYRVTAAGHTVTVYDFGAVGAADRAAAAISSDGYTIARLPYDVGATPRYWHWDRLLVQYMGDDQDLIARLDEVAGPAIAGGVTE
jgi:hypothetical protein